MMMQKAGYIQRNGFSAIDEEGIPWEVVEINIRGERYGVRIEEIRRALSGHASARIEYIRTNWAHYLAGVAGIASISRSGRALNIDLINGERYTILRESLSGVLQKSMRYARIMNITHQVSNGMYSFPESCPHVQSVLPGVV